MVNLQRCIECDSETGRCQEDEMCVGDYGPLCEDCHATYLCPECRGEGFLHEAHTSISVTCFNCNGEGYTQ